MVGSFTRFQSLCLALFRGVASRTAQSTYKRLIQVLVIGSDGDHCPQATYDAAKEVGAQIAARSAITVTGGLGGEMEAAGRGAKEKGGMVVGIIPNEDMSYANPYCDIIIPTGIGFARNFITAYAADAAIVVGGGAEAFKTRSAFRVMNSLGPFRPQSTTSTFDTFTFVETFRFIFQ